MDFTTLLQTLEIKLSQPLPGVYAQQKMAPNHRLPSTHYFEKAVDYKVACVLILFFPDPADASARVVLIERTGGGDVHGGQISFPGGKTEKDDPDLLFTAIRETEEEIGVNQKQIQIVGSLSSLFIPPSNFLVHPFVGFVDHQPIFQPSLSEVQQVLTPSIILFTDQENTKEDVFTSSRGIGVKAPYYQVGQFKVWGATAMMMSELVSVIIE